MARHPAGFFLRMQPGAYDAILCGPGASRRTLENDMARSWRKKNRTARRRRALHRLQAKPALNASERAQLEILVKRLGGAE